MAKFLIVSDIHGDREVLTNILAHWQSQVDGIFYNGDSEFAADDAVFDGVSTVIGNMDHDDNFVAARSTTIDGVTFFQTHGHLYNATVPGEWANLTLMDSAAQEAGAQVVLFGHTHLDGATVFDHKLFINPGSTTLPRGPHADLGGTYAVLEVNATDYIVQFYNRENQLQTDLTISVKRNEID